MTKFFLTGKLESSITRARYLYMDTDRRNLIATLLSRRLWADFRKHGYPCKVGVSVSDLRAVLDAQNGRCHTCGIALDPASCYAIGIIRASTCKITCEKCHARPKN